MKQFHLLITGGVQGVGYRSWFRRQAQEFGVTGWVKNRDDGAVEAIIQGDKQQLETLIQRAKQGPDVGWVEDVLVTERQNDSALGIFEVIY
jgi:acylphosphatase